MGKWKEFIKHWWKWLANWIPRKRNIGWNISHLFAMLTMLLNHKWQDIHPISWCLVVDQEYLSTYYSKLLDEQKSKDWDNYVTALYEHLKEAVSKAKLTANKEAHRYKRVYDRQAGAVELRPGDKVLVRLDAYRGQRRKLKNLWGSELYTVVCWVTDGVPAYVIIWDNNQKKREKVLHRARLLLWFADNDSNTDGIRLNYLNATRSRSSITKAENTDLTSEAHSEGEMGTVPCKLDYGTDFILGKHSLDLLHIVCEAKVACIGVSPSGTGQEVPAQ